MPQMGRPPLEPVYNPRATEIVEYSVQSTGDDQGGGQRRGDKSHHLTGDEASSEELLLHVSLDGAVRGRVGHAGKCEALAHLVVVKERAVRLVDGAGGHLASARRARARTARVRQVDAVLLSLVQHVDVLGALDLQCGAGGKEGSVLVSDSRARIVSQGSRSSMWCDDAERRIAGASGRLATKGCVSIARMRTEEVPSGVISSTVNICGADERTTRDDESFVAGPVKAEAARARA